MLIVMYLISVHPSFAKLCINCFVVINLYVYVFFLGFCSCVFSVFVPSVFGFVSYYLLLLLLLMLYNATYNYNYTCVGGYR